MKNKKLEISIFPNGTPGTRSLTAHADNVKRYALVKQSEPREPGASPTLTTYKPFIRCFRFAKSETKKKRREGGKGGKKGCSLKPRSTRRTLSQTRHRPSAQAYISRITFQHSTHYKTKSRRRRGGEEAEAEGHGYLPNGANKSMRFSVDKQTDQPQKEARVELHSVV